MWVRVRVRVWVWVCAVGVGMRCVCVCVGPAVLSVCDRGSGAVVRGVATMDRR